MNNPIFIFSPDSIIECWFNYSFLKNYTFRKSTLELCFFLLFISKSRARASSEVQTRTNCYMDAILLPVISTTDLKNTKVKLRSVYLGWLVDFDPRPLTVSLRLLAVLIGLDTNITKKSPKYVAVDSRFSF